MRAPIPEAHIRLETRDGVVIERTLRDMSQPLRDENGGYRTESGGYYRPPPNEAYLPWPHAALSVTL